MSLPFPTDPGALPRFARRRHRETRCPGPHFDFEIELPPDAVALPRPHQVPSSRRTVATLGAFHRPGPDGFDVIVQAALLDREMAVADWVEIVFPAMGLEIVETLRYPTVAGDACHVLTRSSETVSRWRVFKDGGVYGGRVLLVEARAPSERYPSLANELFAAVLSVRLSNPSGFPLAEPLLTFYRHAPVAVQVLYPRSWTAYSNREDESDDVLVASFVHETEGAVLGRMTLIGLRSHEAAHGRLVWDLYARSLRGAGLEVECTPPAPGPPLGNLAPASWTEGVAIGRDPGEEPLRMPVRCGIARSADGWVLAAVMGVAPDPMPIAAAVNARAFEILTRHLQAR